MLARNKTTEIIVVDNNQGIDDNSKSKLDVPEIIDAQTKSINVVKYNNTIYAEVVDRKNDIHFVSEVTGHILRYEVHYKLWYGNYYMKAHGMSSIHFVTPFSWWTSSDIILTLAHCTVD